jgi:hypothetical protein
MGHAARVRERALTDAREQVNLLMKELALGRAELRVSSRVPCGARTQPPSPVARKKVNIRKR